MDIQTTKLVVIIARKFQNQHPFQPAAYFVSGPWPLWCFTKAPCLESSPLRLLPIYKKKKRNNRIMNPFAMQIGHPHFGRWQVLSLRHKRRRVLLAVFLRTAELGLRALCDETHNQPDI